MNIVTLFVYCSKMLGILRINIRTDSKSTMQVIVIFLFPTNSEMNTFLVGVHLNREK